MTPRALCHRSVGACTLGNEASAVFNGAVRVTFRVEIPVRLQHSPMTVVAGSIHASITAFKVSAELERETFYRTRAQHRQTPTAP
jgi:hypothetical protein